ncbi:MULTISPECIES: hypothetical protein [Catenuloplanes]|uniref:Secreted protein n=1 Tax=Catenuloplanes niger TaxID=587534 RepID=A0AAE4CV11_9ACTN|nr:hypothetical protein [Catenuloplanes niger]MDR7325735.1 hypothetical protein [Catenuloplanes niger]
MRRRLAYLLVWAVATAVAAGGSWLGIRSIIGAAAPQRNGPLSAAELRAAAPATIAPPTPAASRSASPAPAPATPAAPPTSASPSPSASRSASPTPAPSQPEVRQAGAWQDTGGGVFRREFAVRGGTAVITVSESAITVVSATAAAGFEVDQDAAPSSSRVTFENDTHSSSIWVTWRKDAPYAEITETV